MKNMRRFVTAITTSMLAIACLGVMLLRRLGPRLILPALILVFWSTISFFHTVYKTGAAEEASASADERDRLMVLKKAAGAARCGCSCCNMVHVGTGFAQVFSLKRPTRSFSIWA